MRDYLNEVVRRGTELAALERAAEAFPKRTGAVRWIVAFACGAAVALFPSVCSADALLKMI